MVTKKTGIWIVLGILLLGTFLCFSPNVVGQVTYDITKTDPSGDPVGVLITDETTKNNADILKITSTKSGDNIIFTMEVSGIIITKGTTYFTGYQFNIDINDDNTWDYLVTTSSMQNTNGTDSQLQDDEAYLKYLENSTGNGTNTLTVTFPLSYITDVETIESWNIYATSSVVLIAKGASYVDTAPDDEFGDGGEPGDSDGDGMSDDYEDANGLDKNDPTDAQEDNDDDGYTNLEECIEGTDPNDDLDYPGAGDGDGVHPSTETPTDSAINVDITTSNWLYENKSGYVYIDETVKGTTNGVDRCEFLVIYHFNDGTKDEDYYWEGRYEADGFKWEDNEFTYNHFKETSADWKTWEFRVKGKSKITNETNTERYPTKVEVWVRAFGDETEQNWNQVTKTSSVVIKGLDGGDGDDDGGFLPGFEVIALIAALFIALVVFNHRKK